jgi:hypothetical protein
MAGDGASGSWVLRGIGVEGGWTERRVDGGVGVSGE